MTERPESVYQMIEAIARDVPGWTPPDQLFALYNLVYLTSSLEGDVVEIGSWCGRSTCVLGSAARATGRTRVVSLDLFPRKNDWKQNEDGSYSFEVDIAGRRYGGYEDQTVWKEPFERDIAPLYERTDGIFDIFQESVARHGLDEIVTAYRGTSDLLGTAEGEGFRCKVAFIDGDHCYDAVCRDIRNVEPFLVEGGWIGFDDAFTSYRGVDRAIEDLILADSRFELGCQMTRKLFVARRKGDGSVSGTGREVKGRERGGE